MADALIFDCETTGLVANRTMKQNLWPQCIEFAGVLVDLDTGQVSREWETLIKPTVSLEEKISKITGLTDAKLAAAPAFREVADEIRGLITGAEAVCAHNLSFDREIIDMEFCRLEQELTWPQLICTVEATGFLLGKRLTLGQLHEHLFGMTFHGAHRAMADVKALAKCAVELRRREVI